MFTSRTVLSALGAGIVVLTLAAPSEAGPPLICHRFDAGGAALLPWSDAPGWKTPDPRYDVRQLTTDTLRLLTPDAPVLARMENLRRATIYAAQDKTVAAELLAAVTSRLERAGDDALAWFDAGYLIESYRQARGIAGWDMAAAIGHDGYSLVRKAMKLAGGSPEMEFAASLMKSGAEYANHRRRALAAAKPGSLLAKNLAIFTD
jgi:hypothetical protein